MRNFRSLVGCVFGRTAPAPKPARRRTRLAFDHLETREVPTTFLVTVGSDNGGVNPAPFAGTGTLRQAIVDAQQLLADGDEIVIDNDVVQIELDAELPPLIESHTITRETFGEGLPRVPITPTTNHSYRMLDVVINGASLTLRNLDIQHFGTAGDGGVIRAAGMVTLSDCLFADNKAVGNGGVYATGAAAMGELTIERSLFLCNEAGGHGGAIYSYASGTAPLVTITNSELGENTAFGGNGGAIFCISAIGGVSATDSYIHDNTASGHGGGIYQYGGGITVAGSSPFMTTSVMARNTAGGNGGAIFLDAGTSDSGTAIYETRIFENAAASGGALFQIGGGCTIFSHPRGSQRLSIFANSGGPGAVTLFQPLFAVSIDASMWNPACGKDVFIFLNPNNAPPISVNESRLIMGLGISFL